MEEEETDFKQCECWLWKCETSFRNLVVLPKNNVYSPNRLRMSSFELYLKRWSDNKDNFNRLRINNNSYKNIAESKAISFDEGKEIDIDGCKPIEKLNMLNEFLEGKLVLVLNYDGCNANFLSQECFKKNWDHFKHENCNVKVMHFRNKPFKYTRIHYSS